VGRSHAGFYNRKTIGKQANKKQEGKGKLLEAMNMLISLVVVMVSGLMHLYKLIKMYTLSICSFHMLIILQKLAQT
jgi:biotin transporter BioY